mmetsp:Transcript_49123/g.141213  ORF Transcript_49123/g.141213 Transcript_49123/m.141213 type:complete len:258 (-) Transcript_49123:447-1220(-)
MAVQHRGRVAAGRRHRAGAVPPARRYAVEGADRQSSARQAASRRGRRGQGHRLRQRPRRRWHHRSRGLGQSASGCRHLQRKDRLGVPGHHHSRERLVLLAVDPEGHRPAAPRDLGLPHGPGELHLRERPLVLLLCLGSEVCQSRALGREAVPATWLAVGVGAELLRFRRRLESGQQPTGGHHRSVLGSARDGRAPVLGHNGGVQLALWTAAQPHPVHLAGADRRQTGSRRPAALLHCHGEGHARREGILLVPGAAGR